MENWTCIKIDMPILRNVFIEGKYREVSYLEIIKEYNIQLISE